MSTKGIVLNLVYFQQNTRFIAVESIVAFTGAVETINWFEVLDVKVTELFVFIGKRVVAGAVHAPMTFRPIFITYNKQQ